MSNREGAPRSTAETPNVEDLQKMFEAPAYEGPRPNKTDRDNTQGNFSGELATDSPEAFSFDPTETIGDMAIAGAQRFKEALTNRDENETGTDRVKRVGKGALRAAGDLGVVGLGVTYLAVEATKHGVKMVAGKLIAFGKQAKANFSARRNARQVAKIRAKMNRDHSEANHMNEVFDAQTEAESMNKHYDQHTEAESMNQHYDEHKEAESMNQHYDEHKEAESMNEHYDEHKEALEMNEAFDEQKEYDARLKARQAKYRKYLRKRNRKAVRGEIYKGAKTAGKWIGRMALKALKGAGKLAWKATKATGAGLAAGAKAAGQAAAADWKK